MKKDAFTLAEVLITMTILGVVAAISIPNMIQNYKNRLTVTKLQKAYATINTAAANIKASTGCENVACLQKFGWTSGNVQTEFAKAAGFPPQALKIVDDEKWVRPKFLHCEKHDCADSDGYAISGSILIKDGMWYNANYTVSNYSEPQWHGRAYIPVSVGLEYNKKNIHRSGAIKSPYIIGRNFFNFIIYDNFDVAPAMVGYGGATFPIVEGKIWLPSGCGGNFKQCIYQHCDPNIVSKNSGESCAARIILDGWKIKY